MHGIGWEIFLCLIGAGFHLFHTGLSKKVQSKLLFMVLKTYIFEMKLSERRPPQKTKRTTLSSRLWKTNRD